MKGDLGENFNETAIQQKVNKKNPRLLFFCVVRLLSQ